MSERLSDEELADVIYRIDRGTCHTCCGARFVVRVGDDGYEHEYLCMTCDGTGAFSLSTSAAEVCFRELRERRAADLTAEEREALRYAVVACREEHRRSGAAPLAAALAVLDRLLAGRDGK